MPVTSAITAASLLALSLIMLVCSCLVCRSRRKLCFKGESPSLVHCLESFQCYITNLINKTLFFELSV